MADDIGNLEVRFGGDISGLKTAAQGAKAEVGDFSGSIAELQATMAEQTAAIREGFAQMAAASASTKAAIVHDTEEEKAGLLGVALQVHEAAESFNAFKASLSEIAEVYLAAFAVERIVDWAREAGEAAERTEHMAQTFGVAVEDIQAVGAAFTLMGENANAGLAGVGRLDRAFENAKNGATKQQEAFASLGVDLNKTYTQMELLGAVMDGFKDKADGPQKVALALELFGRAGAALIPFLDQGSEGLAELNCVTEQYGIRNKEAVESGAQLGSAFNENKVAMTGLNEVLTQAFGPVMTQVVQGVNDWIASMIRSYKEGGSMKAVLDTLVVAFKVVVDAVMALGLIFDLVFKAVQIVVEAAWGGIQITFEALKSGAQTVGDHFKTLGDVIRDALTMQWTSIAGDIRSGMARIAQDVDEGQRKIAAKTAENAKLVGKTWAEALKDTMGAAQFQGDLWFGKPHEQKDTTKPEGDTGDGDAKKTGGPSQVEVWQQQLQAMEVTSSNYFGDMRQAELQFWQDRVELTTKGSKDWLEVQTKIFELQKGLAHDAYDAQIETDKARIAADKGSWDQQRAALDQYLADVAAKYPQGTKEYAAALKDVQQAERAHQAQLLAIAMQGVEARAKAEDVIARANLAAGQAAIQAEQAVVDARLRDGQITATQAANMQLDLGMRLIAMKQQAEAAEYQATVDRLSKELMLEGQTPAKMQEILDKLLADKLAHDAQMVASTAAAQARQVILTQQAAEKIKASAHSYVDPIVNAWGQGLTGMLNHTETFTQALSGVLQSIQGVISRVVEKGVSDWLVGELTKTNATVAAAATQTAVQVTADQAATASSAESSLAQLGHAAAVAAGRAWAALEALPGGWLIAPAVAAATLVGVLAIGKGLFSAEGGFGEIPADGTLVETHKQEMILPAKFANPLRDMLSNWGSSGFPTIATAGAQAGPAGAGAMGDVHFHVSAMDSRDVGRFFDQHGSKIVSTIRREMRNGRV